jgi:hypothetical protein
MEAPKIKQVGGGDMLTNVHVRSIGETPPDSPCVASARPILLLN